MKSRRAALALALGMAGGGVAAEDPAAGWRHQVVDRDLPVKAGNVGDYGLTALVDLDRDGDLDFVLGGRCTQPTRLYWYEYQGPDRWVRHLVGTDSLSDVGLAALDVDRDGWPDLVCSGVWYRNPGQPREQAFERLEYAEGAAGAHDVLVADFTGDGRPDVVAAEQEELLPDDRRNPRFVVWENLGGLQFAERVILDSRLGGHELQVGDVDGDGDVDVCSKAWGPMPWNGVGGRMHVDVLENRRR